MLASFLVYLRPHEPAPMDRHVGRWLNGLFYHLVQEADAGLSAEMHHQLKVKPFTISTLQGRMREVRGVRCAVPEEEYCVRYTVLTEVLYRSVARALVGRYLERRPVRLNEHQFEIVRIEAAPHTTGAWVRTSSYEALLTQPRPSRELSFEFVSPTAFRRGEQTFLFPVPESVFHSLLRTWQAFSELPLPGDLGAFVLQNVAASRYDLETSITYAGRYQLLGFVGRCTYRVLDGDPLYLPALNTLADFALFAGVGMKSTQGMGQVRRLT